MEIKGIDVSSFQGTPDFNKIKVAGYSFVIIKAGQGLTEKATFKQQFLPAVLAAGLDWGAYWWTDAVTVEEAKLEAQACLKAMAGLKPTYPVWLDQEYESPCGKWGVGYGKQLRTDMAKAFMQILQDARYYTGLYASQDWLDNWVDKSQLTDFDKWVAQYASKCTYVGSYGIWQNDVIGKKGVKGKDYQTYGLVPGLLENCDVDIAYIDYPTIIKAAGLNGWGKQAPTEPAQEMVPKAEYDAVAAERDALAAKVKKAKEILG
ncbi:MAG: hypothetical protein E7476_07590 [Ruminococcaceae bacterium]|nr:hypothetical protein [Oscillospiraceae bacterium]